MIHQPFNAFLPYIYFFLSFNDEIFCQTVFFFLFFLLFCSRSLEIFHFDGHLFYKYGDCFSHLSFCFCFFFYRENVQKLFEYWCEISPTASDEKSVSGVIVESFPDKFNDQKIIAQVPEFAYPCTFLK